MSFSRSRLVALLVITLGSIPCFAATPAATPAAAPAPPTTLPAPPSTPAELFAEQVAQVDSDLATLLQRRADASGPALAIIDYQIDVRIIERWLLTKAIDPTTDVSTQACIALRVANVQSVGDQIAQRLESSGHSLTAAQLEGLKQLHALTYTLPPITAVSVMDDTCRGLVTTLILVANPSPSEVKNLPPMRPQPLVENIARPIESPKTLADLTRRAQAMNVSSLLKRQLITLAASATTAAADIKSQDEAAALFDMLSSSIEVADGLESNTGVDATVRPKIEQQLTESIVLFTDIRTRSAGKSHLAALSQYRDTLVRVQRLRLPAGLQQKLAPAFVWINSNPEAGAKVLDSIEKYVQLCARYDARKAGVAVPASQKKTLEGLQKQFVTQRGGFLDDAVDLSGTTSPTSNPAGLAGHVDQMGTLLDSIVLIEKLPRATAALAVYKPRPGGGIDKRAAMAVADVGSAGLSGTRDASTKYLADVERLGELVEALTPPVGVAPDTMSAYTHSRMPAVEIRRVALIGNLASQLATGKEMTASDFSKLETLRQMFDSLRLAGDVEAGLSKSNLLARWADWSISPAQLKALVAPYRDATASAFDGFADDNSTPLSRWPDVLKHYQPILVLVKEVGLYADQLADLPTGAIGELAKLMTPMDKQPFGTERYASLAVAVWQRAADATDPKIPEGVFDAMLLQLKHDFNIPD